MIINRLERWPGTESNRRRQPFQGWIRPVLSHSKYTTKAASMSRKQPIYWDKNGTRFWPVKIASPKFGNSFRACAGSLTS